MILGPNLNKVRENPLNFFKETSNLNNLAPQLIAESVDLSNQVFFTVCQDGDIKSLLVKSIKPLFKSLDNLICLVITKEKELESNNNRRRKPGLENDLGTLKSALEFYQQNFLSPFVNQLKTLFSNDEITTIAERFVKIIQKESLKSYKRMGPEYVTNYRNKFNSFFSSLLNLSETQVSSQGSAQVLAAARP